MAPRATNRVIWPALMFFMVISVVVPDEGPLRTPSGVLATPPLRAVLVRVRSAGACLTKLGSNLRGNNFSHGCPWNSCEIAGAPAARHPAAGRYRTSVMLRRIRLPHSETARTVRLLTRLSGVSNAIRCPTERPIRAAPTGVRIETRLSSMLAS